MPKVSRQSLVSVPPARPRRGLLMQVYVRVFGSRGLFKGD
jgi:hypothetical protein